MKIGILGGTFDPPHLGHLRLAQAAIEALELDEVLFIPAAQNPLKNQKAGAKPDQRMTMVQRLIANEDRMGISDMELTRGGPSYTIETITELQIVHPGDYWFLMGADALKTLGEWKTPGRLLRMCRLGVAIRPPLTLADALLKIPEEYRDRIDSVPMQGLDISSTEVRERLVRGLDIKQYVPDGVANYIRKNKLYQA